MRTIPINLELLEHALGNNSPFVSSFLNTTTGSVVRLTASASERLALERLRDDSEYIAITPVPSRTQYQWVEAFLGTIEDQTLLAELRTAVRGPGAFLRFKTTLARHTSLYTAWVSFHRQRIHQAIEAWLSAHAIARAPEFDDSKLSFWRSTAPTDESLQTLNALGLALWPRDLGALIDLALFLARKRRG